MTTIVTIDEYVTRLNLLLQQQGWFKPGMRVFHHPENWHAKQALGLETENMEAGRLGELEAQLTKQGFEVSVSK